MLFKKLITKLYLLNKYGKFTKQDALADKRLRFTTLKITLETDYILNSNANHPYNI